ncbi:unnamed protein product [Spirodela intermedia]|uniref:Uncharacterized protein n=1 Tax=Spirodela intermedia TaxID=51605 RepID=A0A7I8J768_SPIIN|nr:unnamed protein product [Spirodela intermedia]CAA6666098.1 unnamed protein product [Spirodela intermedia]
MAGPSCVFDFDGTIIDCDSDYWVVDGLGATEIFERLLPTMPFNTLMDSMMKEIHEQGRSVEEVAHILKSAPLDPHITAVIKSAHALGCELRIVSDANSFFIETILQHHGILSFFSEIHTNPSYVDGKGGSGFLLTTTLRNHPTAAARSLILKRVRASAAADGKKRFIYLGDGKGDYCSSLQLTEHDFAQVHEWTDGEEQARVLLRLINQCSSADDGSRHQPALDYVSLTPYRIRMVSRKNTFLEKLQSRAGLFLRSGRRRNSTSH